MEVEGAFSPVTSDRSGPVADPMFSLVSIAQDGSVEDDLFHVIPTV
jgi:hypothetical protein